MENNSNILSNPQEFINYLNQESKKVLDLYSQGNSDDLFKQFTQSWTELAARSFEDPSVWVRAITD